MIEFRDVEHGLLHGFTASAPDAVFIGILGLQDSGQDALLRLAAGLEQPKTGEVRGPVERRLVAFGEQVDGLRSGVLAVEAKSSTDALTSAKASVALERLRRNGATILMAAYDESLLLRLSDEIWWLKEGRIEAMGDPREILAKFRAYAADAFTAWGKSRPEPLDPRWRRGDGRAQIELIETTDSSAQACLIWRSGEEVAVRVVIRFGEAVENPVLGIMIRTRVGFEVYGTNTELESAPIGRREAGDLARVTFRMRCDLCPGDYTVTAASHDPDGTAHDWLDDAVAVTVVDSRYTAGVANLRAKVSVER